MPLTFYRQLNRLLHGPASGMILNRSELSPHFLNVAERVSAEPLLAAACKALDGYDGNVRLLSNIISFLRATGLARDIETLPSGSGWRAIKRRVVSDLGRATAPPLPFCCPPGWKHVETLAELSQVGKQLKNCLGGLARGGEGYIVNFMGGREVFVVHYSPLTLLAMRSVAPRLWIISDLSRSRDHRLSLRSELEAAMRKVLAEVGHQLLDMAPEDALHRIGLRAQRDGNEDDLNAAEEAAWVA